LDEQQQTIRLPILEPDLDPFRYRATNGIQEAISVCGYFPTIYKDIAVCGFYVQFSCGSTEITTKLRFVNL